MTRLYRTGDRVRWLPDGTLAYLGRLDSQIKLRGFRIEPGEIESLLRTVPGVADAVVQLREDHPGEKRLAAYLVAEPDDQSGPALLTRGHHTLITRLPDYMHPAGWALLPALPLMPSGKLDWQALPVPAPLPQEPAGYVAPVSEAERLLCDIWQAALHLPQVGVNDNFFTLGGDSILAIQVTSRAVRAGLAVSVRQLFEHKTVRGLAAHLGAVTAVSQAALRGAIGLHPVQQRFFDETPADCHHYNQSLRVSVPADFSLPRLVQLVTALYERHDGLRLRYRRGAGGRWFGQYDETPLALQVAASIQHRRVSGEAPVLAARAAQRSLSLEKGPLLRVVYFDEEDGGGTLLLVMHHLIV
ncbi:phosphopantetheine-binding protein, partial [Photorhabdus khanii]|uniref:phosphopantetheine-binding protein n=1 Tax=Photorhabdus khanii TaxID=1004150 RepID=UPI0012915C4B